MSENIIIFDGQYIADQIRNINKAQQLTEEAIDFIKKASQHKNWKCSETVEINNSLFMISSRLRRLDTKITQTGSVLEKSRENFTELENRYNEQANSIESKIQDINGFNTNKSILPVIIIPTIPIGKITVSGLIQWFKELQERIKTFWDNFINKRNNNNTPTPSPDVTPSSDSNSDSNSNSNISNDTSNNTESNSGELPSGNFDAAVDIVFRNEGGYSDDPNDPGGATNMGITHYALNNAYNQGIVSHNDVTQLTINEAKEIYRKMYWEPSRADEMPDPLATIYFDTVVLCGQYGGGRLLQKAMNKLGQSVVVDGNVGPQTMAALKEQLKTPEDVQKLCEALCDVRQEYHNADRNAQYYLAGWTNRVNRMRNYANNYDYA